MHGNLCLVDASFHRTEVIGTLCLGRSSSGNAAGVEVSCGYELDAHVSLIGAVDNHGLAGFALELADDSADPVVCAAGGSINGNGQGTGVVAVLDYAFGIACNAAPDLCSLGEGCKLEVYLCRGGAVLHGPQVGAHDSAEVGGVFRLGEIHGAGCIQDDALDDCACGSVVDKAVAELEPGKGYVLERAAQFLEQMLGDHGILDCVSLAVELAGECFGNGNFRAAEVEVLLEGDDVAGS